MLNHITIMGRLTRDPELRQTQMGTDVVSFALAVDRDYKDGSGDRQVDFIDCVAWRNTAVFIYKYFTKGRMMVASGRLQIRSWQTDKGDKRRTAEVIVEDAYFGDSKRDDDGGTAPAPTGGYGQSQGPAPGGYRSQGYNAPQTPYGAPGGYGAQSGYSNPGPGNFAELTEDDGDLPF